MSFSVFFFTLKRQYHTRSKCIIYGKCTNDVTRRACRSCMASTIQNCSTLCTLACRSRSTKQNKNCMPESGTHGSVCMGVRVFSGHTRVSHARVAHVVPCSYATHRPYVTCIEHATQTHVPHHKRHTQSHQHHTHTNQQRTACCVLSAVCTCYNADAVQSIATIMKTGRRCICAYAPCVNNSTSLHV